MEEEKIYYKHFRDENNHPYATIALVQRVDNMSKNSVLGIGLSIVSEKDQFCYKTGRTITKGRAIDAVTKRLRVKPDRQSLLRQTQQTHHQIVSLLNEIEIDREGKSFSIFSNKNMELVN